MDRKLGLLKEWAEQECGVGGQRNPDLFLMCKKFPFLSLVN